MQRTAQYEDVFPGSHSGSHSGTESDSESESFDLLPLNARIKKDFHDADELLVSNQREAIESGFNWVVDKRCKKSVYYRCSMSDKSRRKPSPGATVNSRLDYYRVSGCTARMQQKEIKGSDGKTRWVCVSTSSHHNHSKDLPYYTRNPLMMIFDEAMMENIEYAVVHENFDAKSLRAHVRLVHRNLDEENLIRPHHYHRFVSGIRQKANNGENQDELFRQALVELGAVFQIVVNILNQIMCAYFALPINLNYAKCSSGVYVVDCTYSTNFYDKPLLNMISFDEMGNNFPVAFAIMHGEAEEDYEWAFKNLRMTLEQMNLPLPRVIMSDACLASLNGCKKVFPDAAQLLCQWHIKRNVKENAICGIKDQGSRDRLQAQWNKIIDSPTEEKYNENVMALEAEFGEHCKKAVDYLRRQWLSKHSGKFVKCFVDKCAHRNTYNSSRVESFNSCLKRSLDMRNYSLFVLLKKIEGYARISNARMCYERRKDKQLLERRLGFTKSTAQRAAEDQDIMESFALRYSKGKLKLKNLQHGWTWWMFDEVRGQVCSKTLIKLYQYFIEMYGSTSTCTGRRLLVKGLPCYHTMLDCLKNHTPLMPSHFHSDLLKRGINLQSLKVRRDAHVSLCVSEGQRFPTMARALHLGDLTSTNEKGRVIDKVEMQSVIKRQGKNRRCLSFLERSLLGKRKRRAAENAIALNSIQDNPPSLLSRQTSDPTYTASNQGRDEGPDVGPMPAGRAGRMHPVLQLDRNQQPDTFQRLASSIGEYAEDGISCVNPSNFLTKAIDGLDVPADELQSVIEAQNSDEEALESETDSLESDTEDVGLDSDALESDAEDVGLDTWARELDAEGVGLNTGAREPDAEASISDPIAQRLDTGALGLDTEAQVSDDHAPDLETGAFTSDTESQGSDIDAAGLCTGASESNTEALRPVTEDQGLYSAALGSEGNTINDAGVTFFRSRRVQLVYCSVCGDQYHNKRGCPDAPRPDQNVTSTSPLR